MPRRCVGKVLTINRDIQEVYTKLLGIFLEEFSLFLTVVFM